MPLFVTKAYNNEEYNDDAPNHFVLDVDQNVIASIERMISSLALLRDQNSTLFCAEFWFSGSWIDIPWDADPKTYLEGKCEQDLEEVDCVCVHMIKVYGDGDFRFEAQHKHNNDIYFTDILDIKALKDNIS